MLYSLAVWAVDSVTRIFMCVTSVDWNTAVTRS